MSASNVRAREVVQAWGRILTGYHPNLSIEITKECPLRCPGCYAYGDDHLGGQVTLRGLSDYKGDELVRRFMAMIDRGTYWQCAYVIRKGGIEQVRERGLEAFRESIAALAPFLAGRLKSDLAGWDDIKLLSVSVDRLEQWWRPGLLCIGDAAHAMSPIGGVGINLAVQDAVAAARILAPALRAGGPVPVPVLRRVQLRRWWPTALIQAGQRVAHRRILGPVLQGGAAAKHQPGHVAGSARPVGLNDVVEEAPTASLPLPLRLVRRFPVLQGIPGRVIAIGPLPEHAPAWARRPEMPVVPAPTPGVRAAP